MTHLSTLFSLLPPGLSPVIYLCMGVLVFAGACLQGVGGIGFAMLSAPVAAICFPRLVPGPLLAMGCCVSLLSAVRERSAIVWPVAGMAMLGRAVGGLLAVLVMTWMPPDPLAVLFAVSILVAVGLSVLGWRVLPTPGNLAIAGTASGFMGTITSAGAPPIAVVMQNMAPAPMRATIGSILCVGAILSLSMLAMAGRFGWPEMYLTVVLMPWLLGGFALSNRLKGVFSPGAVRQMLLGLCSVGAVAVLVKLAIHA